jgi:hypothetical protein
MFALRRTMSSLLVSWLANGVRAIPYIYAAESGGVCYNERACVNRMRCIIVCMLTGDRA